MNRARRVYRARRDLLVDELQRQLGGALEFTVPSGGMAMWLRVDRSIDVERWFARAAAAGLTFRTGSIFFLDGRPRPFMRLGFARLDEPELTEAVRRLARALQEQPGSAARFQGVRVSALGKRQPLHFKDPLGL